MNYVINFEILKHPINWVTVILMVLIAAIAFNFFYQYQTGMSASDSLDSKTS